MAEVEGGEGEREAQKVICGEEKGHNNQDDDNEDDDGGRRRRSVKGAEGHDGGEAERDGG